MTLWDFVFAWDSQFLSSMLAGILTIIGGTLVAFWFFEREKQKREEENDKREIEKKLRVLRSLKMFRNFLLPWVFNLATTLSDHFLLYDQNRFSNGSYHDDIPELEDIFIISDFEEDGTQIRGTENWQKVDAEIRQSAIDTNHIRSTLTYGLDSLRHIEDRFREFPNLPEMIDEEVSRIVHLPIYLGERIYELQRWEYERSRKQLDINFLDQSGDSDNLKANLRSAGKTALNIILAIELNMKRLEQETQIS